MKIIFIKDLKKQGKKGEIKEVKDGYGNFLIKQGYAVLLTNTSAKILNQENELKKEQEEKLIKNCQLLKEKIEKLKCQIPVKTGKEEKVFGNISTKQISSILKKYDIDIDKKKIKIKESLTTLGVHEVEIDLHKKVTAILKVQLVKES